MKNKGFTAFELLIVFVIFGIIAAIAIPSFIRFQERVEQEQKANWNCTTEAAEWTKDCSKTTPPSTCKVRAEELFCKE